MIQSNHDRNSLYYHPEEKSLHVLTINMTGGMGDVLGTAGAGHTFTAIETDYDIYKTLIRSLYPSYHKHIHYVPLEELPKYEFERAAYSADLITLATRGAAFSDLTLEEDKEKHLEKMSVMSAQVLKFLNSKGKIIPPIIMCETPFLEFDDIKGSRFSLRKNLEDIGYVICEPITVYAQFSFTPYDRNKTFSLLLNKNYFFSGTTKDGYPKLKPQFRRFPFDIKKQFNDIGTKIIKFHNSTFPTNSRGRKLIYPKDVMMDENGKWLNSVIGSLFTPGTDDRIICEEKKKNKRRPTTGRGLNKEKSKQGHRIIIVYGKKLIGKISNNDRLMLDGTSNKGSIDAFRRATGFPEFYLKILKSKAKNYMIWSTPPLLYGDMLNGIYMILNPK